MRNTHESRLGNSAPLANELPDCSGSCELELQQVIMPRLMRVSEVDRYCDPPRRCRACSNGSASSLRNRIRIWDAPGRCRPFEFLLELDSIWIAEIAAKNLTVESISAIIT